MLRVTVIRAKDLPAVDKKLFGKGPASADPFPCMSVEGNTEKGSVKKKCLEPVWLERFELPCEDPDSVFSFEVMDHDNFGAADFMGCVKVRTRRFHDSWPSHDAAGRTDLTEMLRAGQARNFER